MITIPLENADRKEIPGVRLAQEEAKHLRSGRLQSKISRSHAGKCLGLRIESGPRQNLRADVFRCTFRASENVCRFGRLLTCAPRKEFLTRGYRMPRPRRGIVIAAKIKALDQYAIH